MGDVRNDGTRRTDVSRPGSAGGVAQRSRAAAVDAFLGEAKARKPGHRGRLVFALDATMSRQPTWDLACKLQGDMFATAARTGGVDVQLVYFRGFSECRSSRWVADPSALTGLMTQIDCRGGHTQIGRVLDHVRAENKRAPVRVLVFVGDAMEEDIDDLCAKAGELGLLGVKAFLFHEGGDRAAATAFREIARLTGGAYARFDAGAPGELAGLLRAAAAYAAGGRLALEDLAGGGGREARLLLGQMR
jgi:hypothetical protein